MFKKTGHGSLNWLDNPLCCGQQFAKYWHKVEYRILEGCGVRPWVCNSAPLWLCCYLVTHPLWPQFLICDKGIMGSIYSWAILRVKRGKKVQPYTKPEESWLSESDGGDQFHFLTWFFCFFCKAFFGCLFMIYRSFVNPCFL